MNTLRRWLDKWERFSNVMMIYLATPPLRAILTRAVIEEKIKI